MKFGIEIGKRIGAMVLEIKTKRLIEEKKKKGICLLCGLCCSRKKEKRKCIWLISWKSNIERNFGCNLGYRKKERKYEKVVEGRVREEEKKKKDESRHVKQAGRFHEF